MKTKDSKLIFLDRPSVNITEHNAYEIEKYMEGRDQLRRDGQLFFTMRPAAPQLLFDSEARIKPGCYDFVLGNLRFTNCYVRPYSSKGMFVSYCCDTYDVNNRVLEQVDML